MEADQLRAALGRAAEHKESVVSHWAAEPMRRPRLRSFFAPQGSVIWLDAGPEYFTEALMTMTAPAVPRRVQLFERSHASDCPSYQQADHRVIVRGAVARRCRNSASRIIAASAGHAHLVVKSRNLEQLPSIAWQNFVDQPVPVTF